MSARKLAVSLVAVCSAAVACSGPALGPDEEQGLGVATAAVTNVPTDVGCIVITVTGNRVAERRFDVVPGESSVLPMKGLPVGSVVFTGNAYPTACSAVTSSSSPTWLSDNVSATLSAGVDVPVKLPLRRNGSSTVSVDFEDGPTDGGTPDAPTTTISASPASLSLPGAIVGGIAGSAIVTITNTGTSASGPITTTVTGANAAEFSATGCTGSLAPSATCTINVVFAPTARGARTATLNVTASPGGSIVVPLTGTGLAAAQLTITPPFRDFGSQGIGSGPTAPFSFVVSNNGDVATGTPSVPLLSGPDASEFVVVGHTCTTAILPGASCTMTVRFDPSTTGTKNATLSQNPVGTTGVSATLVGSGSFF